MTHLELPLTAISTPQKDEHFPFPNSVIVSLFILLNSSKLMFYLINTPKKNENIISLNFAVTHDVYHVYMLADVVLTWNSLSI